MKPELLSPAGSYEALLAAARNGADAVYLGAKVLNARAGAGNFDREELIRAADYLHERGKKLYVTVNTVVKQSEMGLLEDVARQLHDCRADAAIVQDAGVCEVLRHMLPQLKLHASTQMAISNAQGAEYLKKRGFERVVLAREMDLSEISACVQAGIEVEVFCHGALCVACSGQCLFSSLAGGRSGNRGQCAQPCRLEYELSGAAKTKGYLLSPKDLCTAEILQKFEEAGVTSLKIEGRLKRPEYVAVVTGIYRRLLDGEKLTDEHMEALRQIFNRGGFTRGYAEGIRDGEFLSVRRPSHWGVRVGKADSARRLALEKDLDGKDALVLRSDAGEEIPVKLAGKAGQVIANPAGKTGAVYRMVGESQMDAARKSFEKEASVIPLDAVCRLKIGREAALTLIDGEREATVYGEEVQASESGHIDKTRISRQLVKTGGTPYFIKNVAVEADEGAYMPVSALNALRRSAIEQLASQRLSAFSPRYEPLKEYRCEGLPTASSRRPEILVQSGDCRLLRRLLDEGADGAAFEPDDLRPEALGKNDLAGLYLVLPPVTHGETLKKLNDFAQSQPLKGVYLSNMAHLGMEWPGEKRFDFTLNLANLPALRFVGVGGSVYTPSIELTAGEIAELGGARELIVYGRMPLMRLRHCPLNAARGGGEHAACRACDSAREGKKIESAILTDRMRAVFPLRRLAGDEGCVITLYNSVPLNLSGRYDALPDAAGLRLVFTDETPDEAVRILKDFIRIRDTGRPLPPEGKFTTGHYFKKT